MINFSNHKHVRDQSPN